jgi:hypothetical protein
MTVPDLSDTYKLPVEVMSWHTMALIVEDLMQDGLHTINDATRNRTNLDDAFAHAGGRVTLSYNYLERWVDARKEDRKNERF